MTENDDAGTKLIAAIVTLIFQLCFTPIYLALFIVKVVAALWVAKQLGII